MLWSETMLISGLAGIHPLMLVRFENKPLGTTPKHSCESFIDQPSTSFQLWVEVVNRYSFIVVNIQLCYVICMIRGIHFNT